eukprot:CAMPEP_0205817822 /NCGR_PEP_ID=MMETSP0205-20121125/24946_1 /ASSEMBLY_ACC=CAM_ASM_000278 /TAXON_ID=36767 /ORGANISM="Euplotes focardii, Strain TN1" /LENGTH=123 /DNA_ID=CAMNT_0053109225 /DNA_START=967 /DNA_END=1338 /DNA_ORIENTATION=+
MLLRRNQYQEFVNEVEIEEKKNEDEHLPVDFGMENDGNQQRSGKLELRNLEPDIENDIENSDEDQQREQARRSTPMVSRKERVILPQRKSSRSKSKNKDKDKDKDKRKNKDKDKIKEKIGGKI